MPTVTVTAGPLTTEAAYTLPTRPRAALGVCTLDWNDSVARIGPLQVARKYCGPGENINEHLPFATSHPDVHLIVSVIPAHLDRAAYRAQLAAWPATPGGLTVVPNHEPYGDPSVKGDGKCATPAIYVQSLVDAAADHAAAGSPAHIRRGAILHGWMASTQPWAVHRFALLGGYDASWPAPARALLDVLGWDLYDDANYPNYGKGLGPGYKLDTVAALAHTWDKPFLLGEVGTFDPANQADFFTRLAALDHPPTHVAWWDHAKTHSLVEGDLLTIFRAAM